MIIGVPKEIKDNENRVALTPGSVETIVKSGHQVLIEKDAGLGSQIENKEYENAGAQILNSPEEIYQKAEMIVKVKEPLPAEYDLLREKQILFTFLHLAAETKVAEVLLEKKVTAIAYETVQLPDGSLPILAPMSEVAGKVAVQIGAQYLQKNHGGKGMLLGGVPGVLPADVVIVGGGTVGTNAAKVAVGMGARVTIIDINAARLRYLDDVFQGKINTLASNSYNIASAVKDADFLIGAVLVPGARAPKIVTREMVRNMKPMSLVLDVAIDQGGCIETIDRFTTHSNPTYISEGVIHYAVPNLPGVVPRTSTFALNNATLPYVLKLANKGFEKAIQDDPSLAKGVNCLNGKVTQKQVAESLNLPYYPPDKS